MAGSPPAGRLDLGITASPNADYMIPQMTAKSRIDRENKDYAITMNLYCHVIEKTKVEEMNRLKIQTMDCG